MPFKIYIIQVLLLFAVPSLAKEKDKNIKIISSLQTTAEVFEFKNPPLLVKEDKNIKIKLGGFSALKFIKKEKNKLYFKTITDRGPNGAEVEVTIDDDFITARPFLLPDFSPLIVEFNLDLKSKK